jgi:L-threonylcarbamoyladenylate synthase
MKTWDLNQIDEVINALKNKEVVAIPTDTVFGFASIIDPEAIQKLYDTKKRKNNPIAILASDIDAIKEIGFLEYTDILLLEEFLPGPFTLVINKKEHIPDLLTNGLKTVGVRIPNHPVALAVIKEFGCLAVTSANISGQPPHLSYETIVSDFEGKIAGVVKGQVTHQVASTVVNATDGYKILREGVINKSQIEQILDSSKEE